MLGGIRVCVGLPLVTQPTRLLQFIPQKGTMPWSKLISLDKSKSKAFITVSPKSAVDTSFLDLFKTLI
jgi:hypothetical protein